MPARKQFPANEEQKTRFVQKLKQAQENNQYSQRKLCDVLGITIGTLTKYNRGDVNPFHVCAPIIRNLAKELGITSDTLLSYIETGNYTSIIKIDDVTSWIRSEAGPGDLASLLLALHDSASIKKGVDPSNKTSFTWPVFTDEEAKEWCMGVYKTIRHLGTQLHQSTRGAWALVEEILIDKCKLKSDEMDQTWEIAVRGHIASGKELTDMRAHYYNKFKDHSPLIFALKRFKELENFEPLTMCSELFTATKAIDIEAKPD